MLPQLLKLRKDWLQPGLEARKRSTRMSGSGSRASATASGQPRWKWQTGCSTLSSMEKCTDIQPGTRSSFNTQTVRWHYSGNAVLTRHRGGESCRCRRTMGPPGLSHVGFLNILTDLFATSRSCCRMAHCCAEAALSLTAGEYILKRLLTLDEPGKGLPRSMMVVRSGQFSRRC